MYEGSLYGSGAVVFAVWGFVIATQRPDKKVGSQVTLNPHRLADTLGESVTSVQKAIEFLCKPDPESTTKAEGGRRLIQVGTFDYRVVNGAKYMAIRDEEQRREQNREAQRKFRDKITKHKPLAGEQAFVAAIEQGDQAKANAIENAQIDRIERNLIKRPSLYE